MSQDIVRAALQERLNTWAAAQNPPLPVALQNVVFTPAKDALGRVAPYLAAYLIPADTVSEDLAGLHRKYHGIFQINIVTPAGIGPNKAEAIAAALGDLLPNGARVTHGAHTVLITAPASPAPALPDATTYTVPVRCRYRLDVL